jgi:hypothetical protein
VLNVIKGFVLFFRISHTISFGFVFGGFWLCTQIVIALLVVCSGIIVVVYAGFDPDGYFSVDIGWSCWDLTDSRPTNNSCGERVQAWKVHLPTEQPSSEQRSFVEFRL